MGVAAVRSEKLVAEARDTSGTQRKGNVHLGNRYQATDAEDIEDFIFAVICSVCRSVTVVCSYELQVFNQSNHQSKPRF
jgi:hypothetical protein